MEIHRSNLAAKKLWRLVHLALLLLKRGLISKRKLLLRLNMAIKRSNLIQKPFKAFFPSRYNRHRSRYHGKCEYELTFLSTRLRKPHNGYFSSCIGSPTVVEDLPVQEDENAVVLLPRTTAHENCYYHTPCGAPAAVLSSSTLAEVGGFDLWSEEESIDGGDPGVDDEAEEFIRRFYEQLRNQSRAHLLQC